MPKGYIDIYRISKCRFIEDLSGEGAYRVGGRWNYKGTRMLYCSQSIALSMLEVLVHTEGLPIRNDMCMGQLTIKTNQIQSIDIEDLPLHWDSIPTILDTQHIGDFFIKSGLHLVLSVPSSIIPEERNYLINPLHPDLRKLKSMKIRDINFDNRL